MPGYRGEGAKFSPWEESGVAVPGERQLLGRGEDRRLPSRHAPGSDMPFRRRGETQVRTMWRELDESNGSQLLAEFLQYYHTLEEGLVVQPEKESLGSCQGGSGCAPSVTPQCPHGITQWQGPLSGDRAQQQALCALTWCLPSLKHSSLPPRAFPQAPTSLGYLLLPRDLTHQLLAHQEQFAWELGYPLNSLHQVPNYLAGTRGLRWGPVTLKQGPLALLHPGARVGPMLPPSAGKGTCSCSPPPPRPVPLPPCPTTGTCP